MKRESPNLYSDGRITSNGLARVKPLELPNQAPGEALFDRGHQGTRRGGELACCHKGSLVSVRFELFGHPVADRLSKLLGGLVPVFASFRKRFETDLF